MLSLTYAMYQTQNMVSSTTSEQHSASSRKRPTFGILVSISSSLIAYLGKRASSASSKLKPAEPSRRRNHLHPSHDSTSPQLPPRSPLVRPKKFLTQIRNKAVPLAHGSNKQRFGDGSKEYEEPEDFGDGGVWKRSILMGDKCQPLDFSGVIYYDSTGKQLQEVPPRSPRASPLPGYLTRGK